MRWNKITRIFGRRTEDDLLCPMAPFATNDELAVAKAVGVVADNSDDPEQDEDDWDGETPEQKSRLSLPHVAVLAVLAVAAAAAVLALIHALNGSDSQKDEAAVTAYLTKQGAVVQSVQENRDGDFTAIIGGQVYTVVSGKDKNGHTIYGVSQYIGR